MSRHLATLLFLASAIPSLAEPHPWKSADGIRSIQGEFIKRDATTVTIRGENGKDLTIELSKLHPDEQKWLDLNHAFGAPMPNPVADPAAMFDTLTFGDSRETALAKLKASKTVEMTTAETFIGRSGLNGVFRTRQKIGKLSVLLYFDWTETGKLKELTLQTDALPASAYKSALEPGWKEFVELLGTLYGKPVQKGPIPPMESLADGSFSPSHLWTLEGGGSALLGTAREGAKYQVVVRFTRKKVQQVGIP